MTHSTYPPIANTAALTNRDFSTYDITGFLAMNPKLAKKTRWLMFVEIGLDCVSCGITGDHIVQWWDQGNGLHTDLFATNADGEEVMMTMDHRIPKVLGGPGTLDNLDPMCFPCNQHKGSD